MVVVIVRIEGYRSSGALTLSVTIGTRVATVVTIIGGRVATVDDGGGGHHW